MVANLSDAVTLEIKALNERLAYSITENNEMDFVYFDKHRDLF